MKNRLDVQKLVISFAAAFCLIAAQSAEAQLSVRYGIEKSCFQSAAFSQAFTGGRFQIVTTDGTAYLSPCGFHPSPVPFAANPLTCPLGATGFIASGDVNRDGVRDDLSYWSLSKVVPAAYIEPYRPDRVFLAAAPASTLPRPLGLFVDGSATVFYDIASTSTQQYDLSSYGLVRTYGAGLGELSRFKSDFLLGQYQFTFPALGRPEQSLALPISIVPFIEPFQPTTADKNSFRITNSRWNAGALEMDPRVINKLTWQGNDRSVIRSGVDTLHFGIFDPTDTFTTFPPSGELLIPDPLTTSYNLPPFFYNVGDTGVGRMTFDRGLVVNQFTADISQRLFKFNISFIDTYSGFAAISFPLGSTASRVAAGGDYDLDGFSNILEYAYQSEVQNKSIIATSTVIAPTDLVVTPLALNFKQLTFPTNSTVFPASPNILQKSTNNGVTWVTQVYPGPGWIVNPSLPGTTDITSSVAVPSPPAIFRLTTSQVSPLTNGNFTVTNLGGNIQQITILKRPNIGASLTYGFERQNGTQWVKEVLPTVVGASNARWTLTADDATQLVATSVIPIAVPPTVFRPAVKQNY